MLQSNAVGLCERFETEPRETGAFVRALERCNSEHHAVSASALNRDGAALRRRLVQKKRAERFDHLAGMQVIHLHRHGGQLQGEMRGSEFFNKLFQIDRDRPGSVELRQG
ncbi:MAG: hypothetical protein NW208_00090 [Bryobacter sp.]|nr:hypothetical protein [Bryobacter sp.]